MRQICKRIKCLRLFAVRTCFPVLIGIAMAAITLLTACSNPERAKVKHYRKGLILSQRGRYAEAVEEYQRALKIDSQMPEVYYELGQAYQNLRYYEPAIESLEKARALDSGLTLEILLQIAQIYVASGKPSLAEVTCHDALKGQTDSVEIMSFLGTLKMEQGKTDEGISWLEKVLEIDPDDVESRLILAEEATRRKDPAKAENYLKAITTEIDPENIQARMALAKLYRFNNRQTDAIRLLKPIVDNNPGNVQARGALAEAYLSINRLDEAYDHASAFLEASPDNPRGDLLLGSIFLKKGVYDQAIIHLTAATNVKTVPPETLFLLGQALRGAGKRSQAISSFRKSLAIRPNDPACRLMLAQTLLDDGAYNMARREIDTVLTLEPDNEYARQLSGRIAALGGVFERIDAMLTLEGFPPEMAETFKAALQAFRANDLVRAEELCQDMLSLVSESPLPLNLLGAIRLKQNEYDDALSLFQQAASAAPEFVGSYVNMANIYMGAGNYRQAVQVYEKALQYAPEDQSIQQRYARGLLALKRYEQAESFLRNLIEKNPQGMANRLALANLLSSMQKYESAAEELEKVLEQDPTNVNTERLLAEIRASEGDIAAAAALFEKSLIADPGSEYLAARVAMCNLLLGQPEKAREILSSRPGKQSSAGLGKPVLVLSLQEEKRYEEAERNLAVLQETAPGEIVFDLLLANIKASSGDREGAVESLSRNVRLADAFARNYGMLLQQEALGPADLYELSLILVLNKLRWNRLAVTKLEGVIEKTGPNASLFEISGELWEKEGKAESAISSYRSALAADSSYWPVSYRLGVLAFAAGDIAEASKHFHSALKNQPNSLPILLATARCHEVAQDSTAAIKIYRKINSLYPNQTTVMNNLAWLLAKHARTLDEALEYAQSAVAAQPMKAEAHDTLGWIYFKKGDYKTAVKHLNGAVLLNSLNPSIRYHRGMALLRLGDKVKALEDFRKADSASEPFPEQQLNRDMIRELG